MTEGALHWLGSDDTSEQPRPVESQTRVTTGGGDGDGVGPVCVGMVEGPLRAEIARSYLEQAGIPAFLQGEAIASVYGLVSGPLSVVRVLVPAAQAEEGARVFAELDFGPVKS